MSIRRIQPKADKPSYKKIVDVSATGNLQRALNDNEDIFRSRSIRSRKKKKNPKHFIARILLIFFVTISVLSVSIVYNIRSKVLTHPDYGNENLTDLDKAFDDSENSDETNLKPSEAIEIVTQALANRDPSLIQDFFIIGEGDNPADVMVELLRIRDVEGKITGTEWLGSKFPTMSSAQQAVVRTTKDEIVRTRRAQLALGPDEKWRIDLDAYLRKCDPPLAEVAATEFGTFVVRVFVTEENTYSGIYSEKTEWSAYSLTSPDTTDSLYAYAKRESSQYKAMRQILISDKDLSHATLTIIKQPNSGPRQFEVSRVMADDWIIRKKDFDESF